MRCDMQVSYNFVTVPPFNEADDVGINITHEEHHIYSCAEVLGSDVVAHDCEKISNIVVVCAQCGGDIGDSYDAPPYRDLDDTQWSCGRCNIGAQVADARNDMVHNTSVIMAGDDLTDVIDFYGIIFVVKGKCHKGDAYKDMAWCN